MTSKPIPDLRQSHFGIDTGGTFTDFIWQDSNGRCHIHKQLSTPANPAQAILQGLAQCQAPDKATIIHGSTVATNALLEQKGAPTALLTTAGFADVLAIGRQNRPHLYALVPQKPLPLIPAPWRLEVRERISAQGEVLHPLSLESLQGIIEFLNTQPVRSMAVCLLFSFLHPEHEQAIKAFLQAHCPQIEHISLSSDILPEYREYERTSTTVINAYVAPLMTHYLNHLATQLGPKRRLAVLQSNGGIINAATASQQAARTVLSGPAGGVVGAQFIASQGGWQDIITFDMGGTSTDVALCNGRLPTTTNGEIAHLPIRLPIIDIHTVGAGGGSLATVDAGGALQVGPQSAGANPGPTCYHTQPAFPDLVTTTDANLVLGRLDAQHFLGGTMPLNEPAARQALQKLAQRMAVDSAETAAWSIIQVANAVMEQAIRRISVERGYDPRSFTLVAFGGAGPLHACELAQNLQIPRVLIPLVPGVLSALGMLVAQPTKDYSRAVLQEINTDSTWLEPYFKPLVEQAISDMHAEGYETAQIQWQRKLDMRYVGQSHELTVLLNATHTPIELFEALHEQRYGYLQKNGRVEAVTARLTAVVPTPALTLPPQPMATAPATPIGEKIVWFAQQPHPTALYARDQLQPGHQLSGPAIVFQYDTTTVIPPGWQMAVDAFGSLVLSFG